MVLQGGDRQRIRIDVGQRQPADHGARVLVVVPYPTDAPDDPPECVQRWRQRHAGHLFDGRDSRGIRGFGQSPHGVEGVPPRVLQPLRYQCDIVGYAQHGLAGQCADFRTQIAGDCRERACFPPRAQMIPYLVARHQVTGGTRGRRGWGRTFGAGGLQRGQRTVRGRVLQRCAGRVAVPLVLAQPGAEREPTGILFEPEWRVAFGPALGAVHHEHRRHEQRQDLLADRGGGDIRLRKQRGEPVERGNGIAAEDGADAKVDRKRVTIRDQCLQHVAGSRVVHRQQRVARAVAHRRQRAIPPKLRQQRDGWRVTQRAECPHAVFPWAIGGAYASHRVVGCVVKLPAFFFRQARPVGNGVGGTFGKIRREERGRAQFRKDLFSFLVH
ncbi:hypothetical protein U0E10_17685 [Burkholderia ubonensis]|uniref:hypothetical protein n=1 Tax=Burkholderia ubonensis TaxID=101571 RepID=UPI002AB50811|nr:hypothetical protein [Burkholderia ubonensis]MDY7789737.1 hypothetical protein [Burkholderia ubonensis]